MFMAIGQCGSVLGSHIFPTTQGPRYMCVCPHHSPRLGADSICVSPVRASRFRVRCSSSPPSARSSCPSCTAGRTAAATGYTAAAIPTSRSTRLRWRTRCGFSAPSLAPELTGLGARRPDSAMFRDSHMREFVPPELEALYF